MQHISGLDALCNHIYSASLGSRAVRKLLTVQFFTVDRDILVLNLKLPLSSNFLLYSIVVCALRPDNKGQIDNFRQQTFVLHHLRSNH